MKPPTTRQGRTHKQRVGDVSLYITVNRDGKGRIVEVFSKSDEGMQGHVECACKLLSLGLQGRLDLDTAIRHLRGDRTPPCGVVGQPTSVYDAIARVLEEERGCNSDTATTR